MRYNTKQKDNILKIIENKDKQFTIKSLYDELNGSVGLTTIYRLVNNLVNENILNKIISKDNITYYEYLKTCKNKNHFYLKCDNCLKLIHIDCDCIEKLENHILEEHSFNINNQNIIINGLCKNCRRKV